jgi:S1-C subfamily serine protease
MIKAVLAAAAVSAVAYAYVTTPSEPERFPARQAGSVVKVLVGDGHGTGTNIGGGYVLTAAHVVKAAKGSVKVRLDSGEIRDADILWTNEKYDLAAIQITRSEGIAVSVLSCDDLATGDAVRGFGNPQVLEFVTTYGHISGSARTVGPWASVYPTDITIAPGMSGGPLFNERGDVVGVMVGLMAIPIGFAPALIPFSYAVPSSVACALMGRGV